MLKFITLTSHAPTTSFPIPVPIPGFLPVLILPDTQLPQSQNHSHEHDQGRSATTWDDAGEDGMAKCEEACEESSIGVHNRSRWCWTGNDTNSRWPDGCDHERGFRRDRSFSMIHSMSCWKLMYAFVSWLFWEVNLLIMATAFRQMTRIHARASSWSISSHVLSKAKLYCYAAHLPSTLASCDWLLRYGYYCHRRRDFQGVYLWLLLCGQDPVLTDYAERIGKSR